MQITFVVSVSLVSISYVSANSYIFGFCSINIGAVLGMLGNSSLVPRPPSAERSGDETRAILTVGYRQL